MNTKFLGILDLANLGFAAVVTILVALGWGKPGLVPVAAGALLACINLYVVRRLAARAIRRAAAGDRTQASWLLAALAAKMLVLFGLVWLCIRVYNLALVPFTIGISVLPISLVFTGLWIGTTAGGEQRST
jgi:hypothetical protein